MYTFSFLIVNFFSNVQLVNSWMFAHTCNLGFSVVEVSQIQPYLLTRALLPLLCAI